MSILKPLSNQEALDELIDFILGKDFYIVDPLGQYQANAIIVDEIKNKWSLKMAIVDWNDWWGAIGKSIIIGICIAIWCCIINALAFYIQAWAHPYVAAVCFTIFALMVTAATIKLYC